MTKLTGFDELSRDLKQAQEALELLAGELGSVTFDPEDPSSIEQAIQGANQLIDDRVGSYASNPIIGPMIEGTKDQFRDFILENAAEKRLETSEDE